MHLRWPRPQRREGQRVLHDNRAGGAPTPCSSHTRARARLTPIHAGLAPLCACVPAHAAPTRLRPRDRALLLPRRPTTTTTTVALHRHRSSSRRTTTCCSATRPSASRPTSCAPTSCSSPRSWEPRHATAGPPPPSYTCEAATAGAPRPSLCTRLYAHARLGYTRVYTRLVHAMLHSATHTHLMRAGAPAPGTAAQSREPTRGARWAALRRSASCVRSTQHAHPLHARLLYKEASSGTGRCTWTWVVHAQTAPTRAHTAA